MEPIGRGGMGTVFAAYDEQLDRKVAVKILLDKFPGPESLLRFRREAQAMARLSHPNIVTVHEVGESRGEVFMAMEFILGESLDVWLRRSPPWTEVLEAFIQAGRGLQAAHEAGLVHRDLKPHNIMRTDVGEVKVLDFGLARAVGEEHETQMDSGHDHSSILSSSITHRGAVLGTPAYISPEQLHGAKVDARSDQFSFCVALYEGLYGERPYEGSELLTLLNSIARNTVRPPPEGTEVPSAIRHALLRGLRADPDQRWPSVAELLEALVWDPARRRTGWWMGLVGVGALGLVSGATLMVSQGAEEPCTGAQRHLAGIWDEERRAEVEGALLGTGVPYAEETWRRAGSSLDEYARGWVSAHTEACVATAVREEQSPQMLDRRMGCLRRAALELEARVDTLADADPELARRTHELVDGLPSLSRCSDIEALAIDVAPPSPQEAEAVEAAQRELARAESLQQAGRYLAAREAGEAAKVVLADVEYGPIHTEVALGQSTTLARLGEYEAARRAAVEALVLALRFNQRDVMVPVLEQLMFVLGSKLWQPELAMQHWPMLEELARGRSEDEASARHAHACVLTEQARYDEAEAEFRQVISQVERLHGPGDSRLISSRSNLVSVLMERGEYAEAETELRALLSLEEQALGPVHPNTSRTRGQLAGVLMKQDKVQEAAREARGALRQLLDALGPEHTDVARVRYYLGLILKREREYAGAEAQLRASLRIWRKILGPACTELALVRQSLATVLGARGRPEQAEAQMLEAISALTQALGSEHPHVAMAEHNLGRMLEARGRSEEAEARFRHSLALSERALGPEHPDVVTIRTSLASLLIDLDRSFEARSLIEPTWERLQSAAATPGVRAQSAFVLARALWSTPSERPRARALAEQAREAYAALDQDLDRDLDQDLDRDLDQVEAWLATHRV